MERLPRPAGEAEGADGGDLQDRVPAPGRVPRPRRHPLHQHPLGHAPLAIKGSFQIRPKKRSGAHE